MRKRLLLIALLLLCTSCITGCLYTVEAHRIWVLCKYDGVSSFYYNDTGDFIEESNGKIKTHGGVGLYRYPALYFEPEEYEPSFLYVLPGHFKGTLKDVSGYVYLIASDYKVVYQDPFMLEIYANTGDDSIRIIYRTSGDIQIYAQSGEVPKDLRLYTVIE